MSTKNSLQEYYQKRKLPLPVYKCHRKGGKDHSPSFVATVTLHGHRVFKGRGPSKKTAETQAAEKAWEALKDTTLKTMTRGSLFSRKKVPPKPASWSCPLIMAGSESPGRPKCPESMIKRMKLYQFKPQKKTCIFIDLENKHLMVEKLLENLTENVDILAFASTDHPSLLKLRETLGNTSAQVQLVEVPCTRRDGADVGLILSVGIFLAQENYNNIIIVTSDHFGDALAECVGQIDKMWGGGLESPTATCCRTLESILKALD